MFQSSHVPFSLLFFPILFSWFCYFLVFPLVISIDIAGCSNKSFFALFNVFLESWIFASTQFLMMMSPLIPSFLNTNSTPSLGKRPCASSSSSVSVSFGPSVQVPLLSISTMVQSILQRELLWWLFFRDFCCRVWFLILLRYFLLSSLFENVHFQYSQVLVVFFYCKCCDAFLIGLFYYYLFIVFHMSISWWSSTGVWVAAYFLKSLGLFSVFWPILIIR